MSADDFLSSQTLGKHPGEVLQYCTTNTGAGCFPKQPSLVFLNAPEVLELGSLGRGVTVLVWCSAISIESHHKTWAWLLQDRHPGNLDILCPELPPKELDEGEIPVVSSANIPPAAK